MNYEAYFDSPDVYANRFDFYSVGSSPLLLSKLLSYLKGIEDDIAEINIAFYLYNNEALNDYLISLSKKGITINLVTIPIEGYDAVKPKDIIDIRDRNKTGFGTKYDLARKIFIPHYYRQYEDFNLYFFPHIYLRSSFVKGFSRGNMPYSLHTKSIIVKKKNGENDICLSSSNFAVRDMIKEENLLIIKGQDEYAKGAIDFFNKLIQYSIRIDQFNFDGDYTNFIINPEIKALEPYSDFIAPFFYNSPFMVEDYMHEKLKLATERIIIVGQHVCPINYSIERGFHTEYAQKDNTRMGLVNTLLEKAKEGVSVKILSQTFASGIKDLDDKIDRAPVNTKAFINFFSLIKDIERISYTVNENVHSKYIIIDNTIFVTTFNYTPTEFIYLDNVVIRQFRNNPGKSYSGIFSEVGQYIYSNHLPLVNEYFENYKNIVNKKSSIKIK